MVLDFGRSGKCPLEAPGAKLRLVLHIVKAGGGYIGSLDSPDQGAIGIPVDEVLFFENILTVKAPKLGLQYIAVYDEGKQSLEGTFEQGGLKIPLNMNREAVEMEREPRPQDPKDFPYLAEEVAFANEKDSATLAGTLTLPEDKNVKSVVVLISGSGPQDRNEEVSAFNDRPFRVLSDYLTRQGIGDVDLARFGEVVARNLSNRVSQGFLIPLDTQGRYDHFVELNPFFQGDVNGALSTHCNRLGVIADEGELKAGAFLYLHAICPVKVGDRTIAGADLQYVGPDQGLSICVNYFTCDRTLGPGRHREE